MSDDPVSISPIMSALYQMQFDTASELANNADSLSFVELVALGRTDQVRQALKENVDLASLKAPDGFFPTHFAAFFSRLDVLKLLIEAGADVNVVADQPSHVAPIHSAAASRNAEIVGEVLQAGANPDAQQEGGWTALHSAAMHGNVEMVRVLLDHGAGKDIPADNGSTAASLAREHGHSEIDVMLS